MITNWFLSRREMNHTIYLYSAGEEGQTHLIWKSVSAWFIIYWESHCSGTVGDCVIQWAQSCLEPVLNLSKLITLILQSVNTYNTYASNGNFSTVYWGFWKTRAARFVKKLKLIVLIKKIKKSTVAVLVCRAGQFGPIFEILHQND